ncbi:MAG: DUF4426 domain-containing protein [Kangiellaceae bacterium]|nr:DUF4426 domain-containing protein [Kangiellaceae bacterium]
MFPVVMAMSLVTSAHAAEKKVDDFIIYYNAFNSSFLQPAVARTYKIPRSGLTAVLNVSVHKDNPEDHTSQALSANVQGRVKNAIGQYEDLAFREIKEDNAIYYLADFRFRNKEATDIEFFVRIPGREKPIMISFDQKFYAN